MYKKLLAIFVTIVFICVFSNASSAAKRSEVAEELIRILTNEDMNESPKTENTAPKASNGPHTQQQTNTNSIKASNLIKVEPLGEYGDGDTAIFYDQPNSRARVIGHGHTDDGVVGRTVLYVEPQLIQNEGASWYRAHFVNGMQVKYYYSGLPYFYVKAREVSQVPLVHEEYWSERDFLAYFDQGRPPRIKIGDDWAKVKGRDTNKYRRANTKVPVRLYAQPNAQSNSFVLPVGSPVIDLVDAGRHERILGYDIYLITPPGHYFDMQDHMWFTVVNANNRKVIGWLDSSDHMFMERWYAEDNKDKEFLPPPSDNDVDVYKNWEKVFIY